MNKREAFQAIQECSPDAAQWLQDVAATFGKPEAVSLSIKGQVIYEHGEFAPRTRWMNSVMRIRKNLGIE